MKHDKQKMEELFTARAKWAGDIGDLVAESTDVGFMMADYAAHQAKPLIERIAELEAVAVKAETLYKSIGSHDSGRKWVAKKYIDDLGFALSDIREPS